MNICDEGLDFPTKRYVVIAVPDEGGQAICWVGGLRLDEFLDLLDHAGTEVTARVIADQVARSEMN